MISNQTNKALAAIKDAGLFERLATAILRGAERNYMHLSHPGVNVSGATVKSPVDGVAFIPGANPPHVIYVHHSTCLLENLHGKWFHDPSKVKPRKGRSKPSAPAGDIIKTLEIIDSERQKIKNLKATLILTTTEDPKDDLLSDVQKVATEKNITIDVWPRSRLAHYLDFDSKGQYLRKFFLDIEQELLSEELLLDISKRNLEHLKPFGDSGSWVKRAIDSELSLDVSRKVTFVVAESGFGKSIACYKLLKKNVDAGGFGIILTDDDVDKSGSLEQALEKTLRRFCPSLQLGCGAQALALATRDRQLLISIEDINHSNRDGALVESIVRWNNESNGSSKSSDQVGIQQFWHVLCPIWPQLITSLSRNLQEQISNLALEFSIFSFKEGISAVKHRYKSAHRLIADEEAEKIANALGYDPLLIGLHDPEKEPKVSKTIEQFIESSLNNCVRDGSFLLPEYREALVELSKALLLHREIEPTWKSLSKWAELKNFIPQLRDILGHGEIIKLVRVTYDEKVIFRHDRVRERLLADGGVELLAIRGMVQDVLSEPYFAEVLALSIVLSNDISDSDIVEFGTNNPLALFCTTPYFKELEENKRKTIVSVLNRWIKSTEINSEKFNNLEFEVMKMLSNVEDSNVNSFVHGFKSRLNSAFQARFRNGDLTGGLYLFNGIHVGLHVPGLESFIQHIKTRFGEKLMKGLSKFLNGDSQLLDDGMIVMALRLAGFIAEPSLADAIRNCWNQDKSRNDKLVEYLWASAQCVDDNPETLMGPVCDEWAKLPNEEDDGVRPQRNSLAADSLRFAFRQGMKSEAASYFIERAKNADLQWPITYMLHETDNPEALEFVVKEFAKIEEDRDRNGGFLPLPYFLSKRWSNEEYGVQMSKSSHERLKKLWISDSSNKYVRKVAFKIWADSAKKADLGVMKEYADSYHEIMDSILFERLKLADYEAIDDLLPKLQGEKSNFWWQAGRYIWTEELTKALEQSLERRANGYSEHSNEDEFEWRDDWILPDLIMALPYREAEEILIRNWGHLGFCRDYVIAALFIATPGLQTKVADSMEKAPDPKELFKHFSLRIDRTKFHRSQQMEVIAPYINLLDSMSIRQLWEICNENGWYQFRQKHLDSMFPLDMRGAEFLDKERAKKALDDFISEGSAISYWSVNYWIDDYLKTGVSLDDVMSVVGTWLKSRTDLYSLRLACSVVHHVGERRHLKLLRTPNFETLVEAKDIITDTEFGVCRRTLQ